jgi:NADH dehydrogenase FAD-containing subunit
LKVVAVGSTWNDPVNLHTKSRAEAISLLAKRRAEVASAKSVVIVGAGAVGIGGYLNFSLLILTELSGEIKMVNPEIKITIVHSERLPLSHHYPDHFRTKLVDVLKQHDVELLLNEKADMVNNSNSGTVPLQSGKTLAADAVVLRNTILETNRLSSLQRVPNQEARSLKRYQAHYTTL